MFIVQPDGSRQEREFIALRVHFRRESEPLAEGAHSLQQISIEWMGDVTPDGLEFVPNPPLCY